MHPLRISAAVRRAIARAVAAAHPREMVGAVAGASADDGAIITAFEPLPNVAGGEDRFGVDPLAFAAVEAGLRDRGHALLGFVHSHPDGSAEPSATDRRELWRDCLQLIVSADDRLRAFRLDGDGVHELAWIDADDDRRPAAGAGGIGNARLPS